jgi:serine/threonine protein kinase/tetratricopeptide (TPR) repeat protein
MKEASRLLQARALKLAEDLLSVHPDSWKNHLEDIGPAGSELRNLVESLLQDSEEEATSELHSPHSLMSNLTLQPLPNRSGQKIAHFVLGRCLGEGGMGAVYEAVDQRLGRTVALKLEWSRASSEATGRFQSEARLLARLQHPGIVTLYEAGELKEPDSLQRLRYLSMEPVSASESFLDACSSRTLESKLSLFLQVCDAVHYAHEQGILHRDLKPANILVDDHGVIRLIDFGIGRELNPTQDALLGQDQAEGQRGTWPYMAPEQFHPESPHCDTRSDQFSLGVMLFEGLSGRSRVPRSVPLVELIRMVRSEVPPALKSVLPDCPEDLDLVLSKATSIQREDRYRSVSDLAEDLRRFLSNKPILGSPLSYSRRLHLFVTRNGAACAFAAALLIVVVVAGVSSARAFWIKTRALAAEAEAAAAWQSEKDRNSELVVAFQDYIHAAILPGDASERALRIIRVVEELPSLENDRHSRGHILTSAANDLFDEYLHARPAAHALEQAVSDLQADPCSDSRTLRDAYQTLGHAYLYLEDFERAEPLLRQHLNYCEEHHGPPLVAAGQHDLGRLLLETKRLVEAESLLRASYKWKAGTSGTPLPRSLNTASRLLQCLTAQARFEDSIQLGEEILAKTTRPPEGHLQGYSEVVRQISKATVRSGSLDEAIAVLEHSLSKIEELGDGVGQDERQLLRSDLANLYSEKLDFAAAIRIREANLQLRQRYLGEMNERTISSLFNLGMTYVEAGRTNEGLGLLEKADQQRCVILGESHSRTIEGKAGLADARLVIDPLDRQAAQVLRDSIERFRTDPQQAGRVIAWSQKLANALAVQGLVEDAETVLVQAYDLALSTFGEKSLSFGSIANRLAQYYFQAKQPEKGIPFGEAACAALNDAVGEENILSLEAADYLAACRFEIGQLQEVIDLLLPSVEILRVEFSEDPVYGKSAVRLASAFLKMGKAGRTPEDLERAKEVLQSYLLVADSQDEAFSKAGRLAVRIDLELDQLR